MSLKRYDDLDPSLILEKWKENVNPIGVYVHSPFCPSICKFCIYAGTIQKREEEYSDYYDVYLPKVIDFYKNILEEKKENIVSWFFGGGTPSMMTAETLTKLLNQLPNFKDSKATKTFEIHPAYWTEELLDVLEEYKFTNAVICLQTFDNETLIKQNRVPADFEKIIDLSNQLKRRNINILVDVIAFLNSNNSVFDVEKETAILENDLKKIYKFILPDEISIQTLYQNKKFTRQVLETVFDSDFIKNEEYLMENERNELKLSTEDFEKLVDFNYTRKCFRLVHEKHSEDRNFLEFTQFMDPNWLINNGRDTLSLGSYKNASTETHSNVSFFNYIEHNTDNQYPPKFKFISNSFWNELRLLIDEFEKAGEPPIGTQLIFINQLYYEKEKPLLLVHEYGLKILQETQDVEIVQKYMDRLQSITTNLEDVIRKNIKDLKKSNINKGVVQIINVDKK